MTNLSEERITATFDALAQEGTILYSPYETIRHSENGYPIEFRICPSLTRKPHTLTSQIDPAFAKSRKWGPGSDMYCPDSRLIIAKSPNGTHDIALNLFCVDRPQLMLLTTDSYARQYEALNAADFEAALKVLRDLRSMYVIYNCGKKGGCSRFHKHLQGLQGPPYAFDVLVKGSGDGVKIPFQYFTHRFENGFDGVSVEELVSVYGELLEKTRGVLELEKDEREAPPHNLALWDGWMLVIPRRSEVVGRASANTAGMLGSIWLSEKGLVDAWMEMGVANALGGLGVPP